jgi:hypothetical protein
MKLTLEQRLKLIEWASEGQRLSEINERAAKCAPPFEVSWTQLKHVRRRAGIRALELRAKAYAEAYALGESRR